MKKLMLLLVMLAVVVMVAAAPAMAQDNKAAAKAQAKAAKNNDRMKEMQKTGGVPIDASLLGLGAGVLLVGGGLLVRRVTR
jgi:ribosomal protein L12E/L44/L45/RPP1/RPP2